MVINLQKKVNKPAGNREGKSWISRLLIQPEEVQEKIRPPSTLIVCPVI